jgi:hypothetical protein
MMMHGSVVLYYFFFKKKEPTIDSFFQFEQQFHYFGIKSYTYKECD